MKDNNCMYCNPTESEKLNSLMIPVCKLEVTDLYLFKEQTYLGRCVIAFHEHVNQFFELDDDTAAAFARDMKKVASALNKIFSPVKVNMGFYSDTLPHLHCHIVPKYKDSPDFGSTFTMNVNPPKYLSDAEYEDIKNKLIAELSE